jgi:hypothetical protein
VEARRDAAEVPTHDDPEHGTGRHLLAGADGGADRLVLGRDPRGVPDRDHSAAGDQAGVVDDADAGGDDSSALRGSDIDAAVTGGVRRRRRLKSADDGRMAGQRPPPRVLGG